LWTNSEFKSSNVNLFELSGLPEESPQTSTFPPYGVSKRTVCSFNVTQDVLMLYTLFYIVGLLVKISYRSFELILKDKCGMFV